MHRWTSLLMYKPHTEQDVPIKETRFGFSVSSWDKWYSKEWGHGKNTLLMHSAALLKQVGQANPVEWVGFWSKIMNTLIFLCPSSRILQDMYLRWLMANWFPSLDGIGENPIYYRSQYFSPSPLNISIPHPTHFEVWIYNRSFIVREGDPFCLLSVKKKTVSNFPQLFTDLDLAHTAQF